MGEQTLIVPKLKKSEEAQAAKKTILSTRLTITLIFVTHGLVNSILLGPWNPIRCAYWNRHACSDDEAWVLNWLAFGNFHVCLLLSLLGYNANGKVILEQRLLDICSAIMLSHLSSGIFMIEQLNKPMAALQVLIYFGLLSTITYITATASPLTPLPTELRSSSFDSRKKLPISSTSLGILFLLSLIRIIDMTFGTGQDTYLGDASSTLYKCISSAATSQMMWCTLILGYSIFLASAEQQKGVLIGQVIALFLSQCMLTGEQGGKIEASQVQVGVIATFGSIVVGLLGIM